MDTNTKNQAEFTAEPDRLISIAGTQQLLSVSRSKLYLMLEAGEIPRPVKLGRRTFFSEREIQSWIQEKLAGRQPSARHDK
jgi:prophage regulatory protein